MSFLSSLFVDPKKAGDFTAQSATPELQNTFTNPQVQQAMAGATDAQKQALMSAMASNNTSQGALGQQNSLVNQLASQNGIANQNSVFQQQQGLANQLGALAQGQGPNPAMAQLNNATGQNVANQAALMAGQRGAGSNVGLMARQAAMQGANTQQQAVGQGAAMQAQQQLGAIGALQQQQAAMGNLANSQVGNQIGATSNNASLAQGLQGLNQNFGLTQQQLAQQNQQQIMGGQQTQQQLGLQNVTQQNQANAGIAQQNAKNNADLVTGLAKGIGAGLMGGAAGGEVPGAAIMKENYKGSSKMGSRLHAYAMGGNVGAAMQRGGTVPGKPVVGGSKNNYANDIIDAKLSPGEIVLPRSVTQSKNPEEAAKRFVAAIQAKKGKK